MSREDRIKEIKENYRDAVDGWRHVYDEARDDLRFAYDIEGGQWPDSIRAQRETDGRPIITANKVQKFLRQLRGDQMMNRPRIKVIPVDSVADPKKAALYDGLIRQIEYLSNASIAYDTAHLGAISSSIGFFRLITKYDDDNSFNQSIYIKRIVNPLSVHFDPWAQEFCLEDAGYCFIEDLIPQEKFKKLYPKSEFHDFDNSATSTIFGDWLQNKKVRIAEYFWKDTERKTLYLLESGEAILSQGEVTLDAIKMTGRKIKREREVEIQKVKWCKTNGVEILEETEWPGVNIPVIPVFGDEIVSEGKRYYLSLTRGTKGPQQMYNYWITAATETVALTPKTPFILEARQVTGFEAEWEDAHRTNRPYIRYKAVAGLQKPQREPQTQIPNAIIAMAQQAALDIEDHLGRYEASQGKASNERSGKAITARVQQADKGTYTFVDNLTRAIVCAGRQMIDLIPKIYDTQRALQVMGENGEQQVVEVNKPVGFDENNRPVLENDLSVGKYDVIASVGASYSSKRQEMVQMLIEAAQYAPMAAPVLIPLIFQNSDWPGAEEVAKKLAGYLEQQAQQEQVAAAK